MVVARAAALKLPPQEGKVLLGLGNLVRHRSGGPIIARRMGGAKRYPSIAVYNADGFRKGSTHPTS